MKRQAAYLEKANISFKNLYNINFQTQQSIKSHGLLTDCWPHVLLSTDRGERSTNQFRGDM